MLPHLLTFSLNDIFPSVITNERTLRQARVFRAVRSRATLRAVAIHELSLRASVLRERGNLPLGKQSEPASPKPADVPLSGLPASSSSKLLDSIQSRRAAPEDRRDLPLRNAPWRCWDNRYDKGAIPIRSLEDLSGLTRLILSQRRTLSTLAGPGSGNTRNATKRSGPERGVPM